MLPAMPDTDVQSVGASVGVEETSNEMREV